MDIPQVNITDAALRWLENIFSERFGHSWRLTRDRRGIWMALEEADGGILFDMPCSCFGEPNSDQPCDWWDGLSEGWESALERPLPAPGVASLPLPLIEPRDYGMVIHYDIIGLTYWMLARVEEVGRTDLDVHERFPATSSHAYRNAYLDRPVVDEWLHVLGQVIKRLWPLLELKINSPKTIVSCDVDSPYSSDRSFSWILRRVLGDVAKRRSIKTAVKRTRLHSFACFGDYRFDTHKIGVELIMDANEWVGNAVSFNFIPEKTHPKLDGNPSLEDPKILGMLQEIHERGHEIGVHPGYNSYNNPTFMARSVQGMQRCLDKLGIAQKSLGGRQHFLRWSTPTTANLLDEHQLAYDSTLAYADRPGFRCGTCFEYPMFDVVNQHELALRQRPLIMMECTVIAERYLGLGYSEKSLSTMKKLKDNCYAVNGQFSLLWHNSHLETNDDWRIYNSLINPQ